MSFSLHHHDFLVFCTPFRLFAWQHLSNKPCKQLLEEAELSGWREEEETEAALDYPEDARLPESVKPKTGTIGAFAGHTEV